MLSIDELFAAQRREWPNSVQLLPETMIEWAYAAPNADERFNRMTSIAMTTQYDRVVFYITDPKGGYIGARFGTYPEEYISGFGICKSILSGPTLRDTKQI